MVLQASSNFQGRKHFSGLNGTICSWKHITFLTYVSSSLTWLNIPFAFGGASTQCLLPFPLRLETRILLQWFMVNRPGRELGSHLVYLKVCILYAVPWRKDSSISSFWGFCKPHPPDPYPGTSVSWETAAKSLLFSPSFPPVHRLSVLLTALWKFPRSEKSQGRWPLYYVMHIMGVGLSTVLCWRGSKYQLLQWLLFYWHVN